MNGLNTAIFAYGATGSGKTYTILGNKEEPGIMSHMVYDQFAMKDQVQNEKIVTFKISYIEVYNEILRDLQTSVDKPVDIREDPAKGIQLVGINDIIANNRKEVMTMIKIGNRNRTVEAMSKNEFSSRSHAVLQVIIETVEKSPGVENNIHISKLMISDQAGSEKSHQANKSHNNRNIEGANINRSLLALANCITALSENSDRGPRSQIYIPFRDSKLTRLLKESLSGNSRTVMLACINASNSYYEDSMNTLKYASRAMNIKTHSVKNVISNTNTLADYTEILNKLKIENEDLKQSLKHVNSQNYNKTPQREKTNSMHNFLEVMERRILDHFEQEKDIKNKLGDNTENIDSITKTLGVEYNQTENQQYIRQNNLKQQQIDLNRKYEEVLKQRNNLTMDFNNMELDNIQTAYQNNLFSRSRVELEQISAKKNQSKSEKTLTYTEWNIDFLKNQVILSLCLKSFKG